MILKITERCTMGCTHCLNSATPDGKDMSERVLQDSLDFLRRNTASRALLISGGEPTEHRDFDSMMKAIIGYGNREKCFGLLIVATNGEAIVREPEKFKQYVKFQKHILFTRRKGSSWCRKLQQYILLARLLRISCCGILM